MHRSALLMVLLAVLWTAGIEAAGAQQSPEQPKQPEQPKKTEPISAAARLAAAKTAFVAKSGNTDIPYNVISSALEGWAHFTLVNSPEKADIIIEILASESGEVRISSTMKPSRETGRMEQSSSTTKQMSAAEIKLAVYDAKTKMSLWMGIEHPKSALKK